MKKYIILNIIIACLLRFTANAQYTGGSADGSSSISALATLGTGSISAPTVAGDSICAGNSTTLTATAPGGTYNWFSVPSGGIPFFTGTSYSTPVLFTTTTYYVETTLAGCVSPRSPVTVVVLQMPVASVSGNSVICSGQAVTITASGGTQYNWTSIPVGYVSTQPVINVSPTITTTYFVSISNGFCAVNDSVLVTVNPVPVVSLSANAAICAGQNIQLTASGGTQYNWTSSPVGFTSTLASINVSPAITTTYFVAVSNGSCTSNDSVTVTVNPVPVITLSPNAATICSGSNVQLVASGGTQYNWTSSPIGFTSTLATVTVSPTITTMYTVSVSNGVCSATDSAMVAVNQMPVISLSNDTNICSGQTILLTASGGAQYNWTSNPIGFTSTQAQVNASPTASTIYFVTVSNGMCSSGDSVLVTVNTPIVISISGPSSTCSGQMITLNASGGTNYTWHSNPPGLSSIADSIQVAPIVSTVYYITSSQGQCSASDSFAVAISPSPNVTIAAPPAICNGDQVTLIASGGQNYLWNTGATTSTLNVSPTITTTYSVTVTSSANCSAVDSVTILVVAQPVAVITGATATCKGMSSTLIASGGSSFIWSNGSTSASIQVSPFSTTTYSVTVSNGACTDTTSAQIEILDEESTLYIPNVFTPNGDGTNEVFAVGASGITNFQGMIYNRWGELLFTWNDFTGGWDGTYKGNPVSEGVYVYVITCNTACDEGITRRGAVTVLR